MFTSKNNGFHIKGQYRKCDSKPYCIDFNETFGNISFWVKNKYLEIVAVRGENHEVLTSKYNNEGFLKGSSYVFFDDHGNTIMKIKKGSLFKGHTIFLDEVEIGRISPKKNQEIKGMSLSISSTRSNVEIISNIKTTPNLADLCVGYFCWLMFKRWDEMD